MGKTKYKKKKKNNDTEKKLALQLKKEAKAEKAARKRLTKQQSRETREQSALLNNDDVDDDIDDDDDDDDDLDLLIATHQKRDLELQTPTIERLNGLPYPPRANATLVSTSSSSSGELYLFGGEYYDGAQNIVFDELYKWDPDVIAKSKDDDEDDDDDKNSGKFDSNHDALEQGELQAETNKSDDKNQTNNNNNNDKIGEWRIIHTPPPHPSPRCSHTLVHFNNALYLFGGEMATIDQYHHYRDLWKLDLKTHLWTEIKPLSKSSTSSTWPSPRSGHRAIVWRHYMIIFGGFHEALRESARWFNDLFVFDFQTQRWQEIKYDSSLISKPPPRSGCNFVVHPSTNSNADVAFVWGGYSKLKNPSPQGKHKSEGKVHTDMWALHLRGLTSGKAPTWERLSGKRGEYPSPPRSGMGCVAYKNKMLVYGGVLDEEFEHHTLRSVFYDDLFAFDMDRRRWFRMGLKKKSGGGGGSGRRRRKKDNDGNEKWGENEVGKDAQDADDDGSNSDDDDDDDDDDEKKEGEAQSSGWDLDTLRSNVFAYIDGEGNIVYEKIEEETKQVEENDKTGDASEEEEEEKDEEKEEVKVKEETVDKERDAGADKEGNEMSTHALKQPDELTSGPSGNLKDASSSTKNAVSSSLQKASTAGPVIRETPLPRINPALAVRSNTLYLYGGLLEIGDREVTLDDLWSLDLAKRERWVCLSDGTMHRQVWRGERDDDSSSYVSGGGMSAGIDLDEDDDGDESDEEEEEEEEKEETKDAMDDEAKEI